MTSIVPDHLNVPRVFENLITRDLNEHEVHSKKSTVESLFRKELHVDGVRVNLDDFGLFSDYQHGFRRHLSCESQLILLYQDVKSSVDNKKSVDLAFIDFSKAFDRVPHEHLLAKLKTYV